MAALRSQRIEVVVELARRKLNDAALALRQQQDILNGEKKRHHELRDYYHHYIELFGAKNVGLRGAQIGESRKFLGQMAKAIEGQGYQVERVEYQLAQLQAAWHSCYLKVQSLTDLQSRYRVEEAMNRDALEQAAVEEWVTLRSNRTP
ncbi:flagellar FliJ family protein [Teredinibacter purpureus]|uniref:flagellar FliJ family protein n=1 Tax=Teredinibacter purpureus TaxID=2731756 RepID=UPI0005F7C5C5|nr:flagellar FliJ family protein [Teredinibacter purpureus]